MPQSHGHRTGVLMARLWVEDGSADRWRCRITRTTDVSGAGGQVSSVVTTPEQVCSAVREWIDGCQRGAAAVGGGRPDD